MGNQGVGRVKYVAVRTVVLFKPNDIALGEFPLKGGHIAYIGTPERINRLIIITHCKQRCPAARQQLQPAILQIIGILKLINENVLEATLIMFADRGIAQQQLVRAQQ